MVPRGAFVVPIHDLELSGREVHFPLTSAWLRGALEGCEMQPAGPDGSLDAHLLKTGNDVFVQGQIDVELAIPCARCLAPVSLRPHIELSLLLHPATPAEPPRGRRRPVKIEDPTEFASDDADTDTYEGEEVVLDRFVREAILLESPIFPLCSESCEGIRPAGESALPFGAATDPRLLPLAELARRRTMKE